MVSLGGYLVAEYVLYLVLTAGLALMFSIVMFMRVVLDDRSLMVGFLGLASCIIAVVLLAWSALRVGAIFFFTGLFTCGVLMGLFSMRNEIVEALSEYR